MDKAEKVFEKIADKYKDFSEYTKEDTSSPGSRLAVGGGIGGAVAELGRGIAMKGKDLPGKMKFLPGIAGALTGSGVGAATHNVKKEE